MGDIYGWTQMHLETLVTWLTVNLWWETFNIFIVLLLNSSRIYMYGGGCAASKISWHEEVSIATLTQPTTQAPVILSKSVETTHFPMTYTYPLGGKGRERSWKTN